LSGAHVQCVCKASAQLQHKKKCCIARSFIAEVCSAIKLLHAHWCSIMFVTK